MLIHYVGFVLYSYSVLYSSYCFAESLVNTDSTVFIEDHKRSVLAVTLLKLLHAVI